MKVLVNGYNLRGMPVGIANVVINFVNSLAKLDGYRIEIVISDEVNSAVLDRFSKLENICFTVLDAKNSLFWLFIALPKYVNAVKPDLFWNPSPLLPLFISGKIKKLVTIHDFVSRDFPQTMTKKGKIVSAILEPNAVRSAHYIICDSNYTKNRMLEIYPKVNPQIITVGCAPSDFFKQIKNQDFTPLKAKLSVTKEFLLFVGSLEPRKNLSFLLNVFKDFHKAHNMQLVIVGARKWGNTAIKDIIYANDFPSADVIFTDFISEEELRLLYNNASCYVSTSLNEGYGLPQAEALKCGCPVVSAKNSAMIEVVENAGILVEGWNISRWTQAIHDAIIGNYSAPDKEHKLEKFTWDYVVQNVVKIIGEN